MLYTIAIYIFSQGPLASLYLWINPIKNTETEIKNSIAKLDNILPYMTIHS